MPTITIKISDKIYDQFKSYVDEFDHDDFEILTEHENYYEAKKYIQHELIEMREGRAKYYTLEEFENILDKAIDENLN